MKPISFILHRIRGWSEEGRKFSAVVLFSFAALALLWLWKENISSELAVIDGNVPMVSRSAGTPEDYNPAKTTMPEENKKELSPVAGITESFEALGIFAPQTSEKSFFGLGAIRESAVSSMRDVLNVIAAKIFHGF